IIDQRLDGLDQTRSRVIAVPIRVEEPLEVIPAVLRGPIQRVHETTIRPAPSRSIARDVPLSRTLYPASPAGVDEDRALRGVSCYQDGHGSEWCVAGGRAGSRGTQDGASHW